MTTSSGRLKTGYYALTAFGSLATSYYFNYLFFFLRDQFGFENRGNLTVAALHGGIYVFASVQGGRYAERYGLHRSLRIGFAGLVACMLTASVAPWVWLHLLVLIGYTLSVCFIWPAVEALITHDEPASRVPHAVGAYNCTWSIASATAYFTGGAIYDSLGPNALFLLPCAVFAIAWYATGYLERRAAALHALSTNPRRKWLRIRSHARTGSPCRHRPSFVSGGSRTRLPTWRSTPCLRPCRVWRTGSR